MENKVEYKVDKRWLIVKSIIFVLTTILSSVVISEKAYNLSIDNEMLLMLGANITKIRYVMPVMMVAIYYGLFSLYVKFTTRALNVKLTLFSHHFEINQVKDILLIPFSALALYIGLLEVLFVYYPFLSNLLLTLLKCIGLAGVVFWMYKKFSRCVTGPAKELVLIQLKWQIILLVALV